LVCTVLVFKFWFVLTLDEFLFLLANGFLHLLSWFFARNVCCTCALQHANFEIQSSLKSISIFVLQPLILFFMNNLLLCPSIMPLVFEFSSFSSKTCLN
jgi:accessory gene regulator protein AgrB